MQPEKRCNLAAEAKSFPVRRSQRKNCTSRPVAIGMGIRIRGQLSMRFCSVLEYL